MPTYDFDFPRYIARRKGQREAQVREGAAYAFPGDTRVSRTLSRLRPVELALEEAARLFKERARAELLGPAVRATPERHARVFEAAARAARALHLSAPPVYVTPQPGTAAQTLGTVEDATVIVPAPLAEALSPDELADLLGRECGRIQNGHVPYMTALHYLTNNAGGLTRWAVKPATASLTSWARRAQITADRAGLLCSRSLDVSLAVLRRDKGVLDTARRERALTRFAGSQYFRKLVGQEGGEPAGACDAAVAELLSDEEGAP